jgi:phage pi2 protein 07
VAVCPEQEEKPYLLKRQDILIYQEDQDELFAPLYEKVPEPGSGGMVHFPTPAGTRWSDIKIQFRDSRKETLYHFLKKRKQELSRCLREFFRLD